MSKESGGLSRDEFIILQEQLLELRNKNYELQEELRRKNSQLAQSTSAQSPKNEALQFASKLINRGKDQKELAQRHEAEVDALRMKWVSQEEEFRLQQDTLIAELNKVVGHNEQLQAELSSLRNSTTAVHSESQSRPDSAPYKSEISRLTGELESSLSANDKLTAELSALKGEVRALSEGAVLLETTLNEKDIFVTALESQILEYKERLEKSTTASADSDSVISELRDKLVASEADCLSSKRSLDSAKEDYAKLETATTSNLNDLRLSLGKSENVVADLTRKLESLEQRLCQVSSQVEIKESELLDANQKLAAMSSKLADKYRELEDTKLALMDSSEKLVETEQQFDQQLQSIRSERSIVEEAHALEKAALDDHFKAEQLKLQQRIEELEAADSKLLEERILLLETRYQLELSDLEKLHLEHRDEMQKKVDKLEESLASKDHEKAVALKKQAAMLKELQRAVKEERKRADSMEKGRSEREGWHVVDSDERSNHTFDGNDSVSSVSALESDNAELISRLTTMQKTHAEAVDRVNVIDSENARLRREICEKNELIEHWIRTRPMPSQGIGNTPQKTEGAFRKFLSSTLVPDESANDMKDMNRRLQRMLEETLSKNILLQRDLQTLLERTEM